MYRLFFFLVFALLIASCGWKTKTYFLTEVESDVTALIPAAYDLHRSPCANKLNYIPDPQHPEQTPVKFIRVNFHIMNDSSGQANFPEDRGRHFVRQVLDCANDKLRRNSQMRLPLRNNTPVVPIQYQYQLTPRPGEPKDDGIYFHYDNELYGMISHGPHKNNYDRKVFDKYGIQKDTVMNIFVMTLPLDSLQSPTFKKRSSTTGIAMGTWLKVNGWWDRVQDTTIQRGRVKVPYGKWYCQKLLNHEVGHNLGLRHTWRGNDGCDDTPNNPNCWGKKKGTVCDSLWGNNVMDYNTHASAWSPCQVGTAHYEMSRLNRPLRKLLVPTWCDYDPLQTVEITDSTFWRGAKDLSGDIIVQSGGYLEINCRVFLPSGAKIRVEPGGQLVLRDAHIANDCGEQWEGIEIVEKGRKKGEVIVLGNTRVEHTVHALNIGQKEDSVGS